MRGRLWGYTIVATLAVAPATAQDLPGASPNRVPPYYAAPGLYGVSFGSASFGVPRTYSEFSSPYGAGYLYGLPQYGLIPGRYGAGLWRPGVAMPDNSYDSSHSYRTFPTPEPAAHVFPPPPLGVYAPGFGPNYFYDY